MIPVSKLYYVPSRNLIVPKIPENPTTEEVRETVNLINEVYINFPFDSPASRTNAIAANGHMHILGPCSMVTCHCS